MATGNKKAKKSSAGPAQGRSLSSILGETGYLWPAIGALVLLASGLFFWWIMRSGGAV